MIQGRFKIFKFFLGLIVIFCLFIFFMVTAMASAPYFTSKYYQANESPSSLFYVVLESFDPHLNQDQYQCIRWDEFQDIFQATEVSNVYICRETDICAVYPIVPEREYTTYLSVSEGSCSNISSDFKVQNVDAHTQVVRLRWAQEAFKVRNSYRVDNNGIIPLFLCKFMSAGICIMIFLVSVVALPITVILFRFCHKKCGKFISTGLALILVGLGTLNFAVFNHRLSLDALTETPEDFIFRNRITLIVSCILFVCAAISFWVHRKKRLITGYEG